MVVSLNSRLENNKKESERATINNSNPVPASGHGAARTPTARTHPSGGGACMAAVAVVMNVSHTGACWHAEIGTTR